MGTTVKRAGAVHLDLVARGSRTVNSASLSQAMLSDDAVKYSVESKSVLDLKINDTIEVFGNTYRLNSLPSVKNTNNSSYQYDIEAQGLMYDLLRCKFFNADAAGFKTTANFPLIGNLETFLIAIKNNMSRFSTLWEIGTFAETETKMMTFGDDTCLSALQKICQEFKTDFWVKSEGGKYKIHTGEFGSTLPIEFEYGKGKGLYSLNRSNIDNNGIVNRLYVNGGSENIAAGYRNFSDNLKFSDAGYLEDVALIAEIGLKEGSIEFPEIYPKRTGKITSLGATKFKFKDSTMDFDLNEKNPDGSTKYLIAGTTAKVHFNTGNLAGYEFEIKKNGYNTATKEFEIIPFKNESGQKFPDENALAFQFSINDEYVLLDIVMPQIYVTNAETELLTKGTEQFLLNKTAKVSYDLEVDPEYLKTLATPISIGDYVRVKDPALGIDKVIRVQQITRNFITANAPTPYNYKITLADSYEINYASQMILDIKDIKNVVNITNLGSINLSQLGYKTTEELRNLVFDTDGFFDAGNIKPFSIQTNMLTVGAQSQQLSCSVVFSVNDGGIVNKIDSKAGVLFSQTFNKSWNIAALNITIPDNNFRYVYAKCSKIGSSGSIFYTQSQIKFDEDPNDYYFLLGILHTVTEGVRVLSITIGTTTINGGLIRTGIISSLDGQTTFNLNTGEIKGKITFTNDSPAFEQINASIIIGGRNLAKNSKKFIDSNSYFVTDFSLSEPMEVGSAYTVAVFTNAVNQNPNATFRIADASGDIISLTRVSNNKFQATFNAPRASDFVIVFREPDDASYYQFLAIKLEKGTKGTDWSPAPEDIDVAIDSANTNSANALAQAQNAQTTAAETALVTNFLTATTVSGNVVSTGTMQVGDAIGANAMISGVTDKANGESIRFAAGKDYANKYLSPFQVLDNGLMRFVNPLTGQRTFELGFNQNTGKVVFDIYNDEGIKIATIGSQGIVFTGYIAERYTETKFRKCVTNTFTQSAIASEVQSKIDKVFVEGSPFPNYTTWRIYNIKVQQNTTAYLYNEGRNFESAGNAQYAGFYTTQNKLGDKLPNGIYVEIREQEAIVGNFSGTIYPTTFNYYVEAYLITDGVISNTLMVPISVTLPLSGGGGA